jgi:hypothetical protein
MISPRLRSFIAVKIAAKLPGLDPTPPFLTQKRLRFSFVFRCPFRTRPTCNFTEMDCIWLQPLCINMACLKAISTSVCWALAIYCLQATQRWLSNTRCVVTSAQASHLTNKPRNSFSVSLGPRKQSIYQILSSQFEVGAVGSGVDLFPHISLHSLDSPLHTSLGIHPLQWL